MGEASEVGHREPSGQGVRPKERPRRELIEVTGGPSSGAGEIKGLPPAGRVGAERQRPSGRVLDGHFPDPAGHTGREVEDFTHRRGHALEAEPAQDTSTRLRLVGNTSMSVWNTHHRTSRDVEGTHWSHLAGGLIVVQLGTFGFP